MRRTFLCSLIVAGIGLAGPGLAAAQALEKQKVTIAVGGKAAFYYLPLTIAEQLGYFKDEGLNVEIVDFAGGSAALRAVVGGSAAGCAAASVKVALVAPGRFAPSRRH